MRFGSSVGIYVLFSNTGTSVKKVSTKGSDINCDSNETCLVCGPEFHFRFTLHRVTTKNSPVTAVRNTVIPPRVSPRVPNLSHQGGSLIAVLESGGTAPNCERQSFMVLPQRL